MTTSGHLDPNELRGPKLTQLRNSHGRTQKEVAEYCETSIRTVCRWEQGTRPYPKHRKLLTEYFFPSGHLYTFERYSKTNQLRWKRTKLKYKLIAFDCDATLLVGPGFKFSWKEVWRHLKGDDALRRKWLGQYTVGQMNYDEWCDACLGEFRRLGCTRRSVQSSTTSVTVRRGAVEILEKLKLDGARLAIVSGGIDTFLYSVWPKAKQIFDEIHINQFGYTRRGQLFRISPSPADFSAKGEKIRAMAEQYDIPVANCAFIGEGFNDMIACGFGGLSIAVKEADSGTRESAMVQLQSTDFSELLDHLYEQ